MQKIAAIEDLANYATPGNFNPRASDVVEAVLGDTGKTDQSSPSAPPTSINCATIPASVLAIRSVSDPTLSSNGSHGAAHRINRTIPALHEGMIKIPRVVVTGAAGYLRPHVVTALLDGEARSGRGGEPGKGRARPSRGGRRGRSARTRFRSRCSGARSHAVVHLAWKEQLGRNSSRHMSQLSVHFTLLTSSPSAASRIVARPCGRLLVEVAMETGGDTDRAAFGTGIAKEALRRCASSLAIPSTTSLAYTHAHSTATTDAASPSSASCSTPPTTAAPNSPSRPG